MPAGFLHVIKIRFGLILCPYFNLPAIRETGIFKIGVHDETDYAFFPGPGLVFRICPVCRRFCRLPTGLERTIDLGR